MAIMIPGLPLDVDKTSKEDYIFNIFKKKLPDDVYVCHSLSIYDKDKKGNMFKTEIDFVILIPNKGILLVESKAGQIYPEVGENLMYMNSQTDFLWHLADGSVMKYNGPFLQQERAIRLFKEYINGDRAGKYGYGPKVFPLGCICLPTISKGTVNKWNLPPNAGSSKLILSKDDLESELLYERILEIIEIAETQYTKTGKYYALNDNECKMFINTVIAPPCNLIPSKHFFVDIQNNMLSSFLKEQMVILDFLEEQKIAVIGGAAGTGKTVIALEKARRLSEEGKKVLFICYNRKLKEYLAKNYDNDLIRYETIDSLACFYNGTYENQDYQALTNKILEEYENGNFDYSNFIIDETQDFGKPEIENSEFLCSLQLIAETSENGSLYMFYDKYQLVQSKEIPSVVANADCKMTLFKNCRNTYKIASTSYKFFHKNELSKRKIFGFTTGKTPILSISNRENNWNELNKLIINFKNQGYENIVVLTLKTLENSSISSYIKNETIMVNGNKYKISTCRKFKGLEADVILLIDVDTTVLLDSKERLMFYVGASRAKFELGMIFNLTDNEIEDTLSEYASDYSGAGTTGLYLALQATKLKE